VSPRNVLGGSRTSRSSPRVDQGERARRDDRVRSSGRLHTSRSGYVQKSPGEFLHDLTCRIGRRGPRDGRPRKHEVRELSCRHQDVPAFMVGRTYRRRTSMLQFAAQADRFFPPPKVIEITTKRTKAERPVKAQRCVPQRVDDRRGQDRGGSGPQPDDTASAMRRAEVTSWTACKKTCTRSGGGMRAHQEVLSRGKRGDAANKKRFPMDRDSLMTGV